MTRQEAIALVREVSNYMATRPEIDEAIDMAIEALEQEPKWIPTSERLPEDNRDVLMCLEWGIDIGTYDRGEWHSEWINHYDDDNVIAWMPLPEPYDEGAE